ncbi:PRK06851 family protein [Clostridium weizhouense]|uniref:PRK06851 family protein n=1 Tax=Clostridium weizhouense TaxID=2859781 RepID=A0ABS7AUV6_9CLOT|nr:PRK06851 family protein [Clostridium weizhouense]MBW6411495.1 PRK06851 family protein [Clostridium weizhouense]
MSGKILNYYACANTSKGFCNLFPSNLEGLDKIFILKGGPGTGKSTLIRSIGNYWNEKNYDIEFIHCSSDNGSLDGVIIPKLKVGIVDGTAPHIIEPNAPGAIEEYVNLGVAWNSDKLKEHTNEIIKIKKHISTCYENAYKSFAKALAIHDDWEKIYIENMNFKKADTIAKDIIAKLVGNSNFNKKSNIKHRFFGGATPKGPVDFVENLTSDIPKRYFIKGRPGSGKSTLLKKLVKECTLRGIDAEVYHCGFDPDSLDMIVMRELGLCIFDSTAPHEYFPSRENDEILDMYKELISENTDEKYASTLSSITTKYKELNSKGIAYLAKAKSYHDDLEKIYVSAIDFSKIDSIRDDLIKLITSLK